MPLDWTLALRVDDGVIDDDHRFLIAIINRFNGSMLGEPEHAVFETLARLRAYAAIHFRREEALQRQVGYAGNDRHVAQHAAMMMSLHRLCGKAIRLRRTGSLGLVVGEASAFLGRWLQRHIIGCDLLFAPLGARMRQFQGGMTPLEGMLGAETPPLADASELRRRASDYRNLAEVTHEPAARRHRYEMAEHFDRLAAQVTTWRDG